MGIDFLAIAMNEQLYESLEHRMFFRRLLNHFAPKNQVDQCLFNTPKMRTSIFEWCVVCVGHQKDMCLIKIGLRAQNMLTIQG